MIYILSYATQKESFRSNLCRVLYRVRQKRESITASGPRPITENNNNNNNNNDMTYARAILYTMCGLNVSDFFEDRRPQIEGWVCIRSHARV